MLELAIGYFVLEKSDFLGHFGVPHQHIHCRGPSPQRIPLTGDDRAAQKTTETAVSLFRAGGWFVTIR